MNHKKNATIAQTMSQKVKEADLTELHAASRTVRPAGKRTGRPMSRRAVAMVVTGFPPDAVSA